MQSESFGEVFIDASFWLAYANPRDERSRLASRIWNDLSRQRLGLVTTNWTLYEALTYLNSRRTGRHDLAERLLDVARRRAQVVDASQFEQQALDIFISHSDKRWSVVDCANFVCIRERGSLFASSFDRDFVQAQSEFSFRVLGLRS
ncbi:MAG: type II toxin-antitoxin system VapC family toxin [Dehalococcoidia bacterium]|nr:type II toxin-antitoxin system VapC family toxin [Dehalococcoidia bacterium]